MAGISRDGPKQHPASLGGAGGQRGAGSPRLPAPQSSMITRQLTRESEFSAA